jgi:transcriptional regulator with XRE-family HTH domain
MGTTIFWMLPMEFVQRLITLRKERGLTQQSLASAIDLHVNQIKRYEGGTAQPTLETLVRLAKELNTTLDDLVFGEDHRGPDEDLKLQFEALSQFDESERMVAKELLESLILKHNAKRAFADKLA